MLKQPAVIIALDFANLEQTLSFLKLFQQPLFVKVGMELYLQNGPQVIQQIKALGHNIFLDLKLHDIPNTVYHATKGLQQFDISLLTIHAAGGLEMMAAAQQAVLESNSNCKLLAITQLTSTSQAAMQQQQLINTTIEDSVLNYASLAQQAGLAGVVSSTHETALIRNKLGNDFLIVNPGIRLAEDAHGDQQRVATPALAKQLQASYIVVGRPITRDPNPVSKYQQFINAFN